MNYVTYKHTLMWKIGVTLKLYQPDLTLNPNISTENEDLNVHLWSLSSLNLHFH